jgi:hypothetical protein
VPIGDVLEQLPLYAAVANAPSDSGVCESPPTAIAV